MRKLIIISVILIIAAGAIATAHYWYGDKTCDLSQLAPGIPLWICYNPDGGMDHSFLTYPAMHEYYTGLGYDESLEPPQTYIYVEGGSSEAFSGR